MGTSKSTEGQLAYVGSASLFSGRPDPVWQIDEETGSRLEKLWNAMEQYHGPLPQSPPLGYRGCALKDSSNREWLAFEGVVTLRSPSVSESRVDTDREFESLLLSSAPAGVIPHQIVDVRDSG